MARRTSRRMGRRGFLGGALAAGGLLGLGSAGRLLAATPTDHRLVTCYLTGAWDVLLGLDPRDPARRYPGVQLGTDALAPRYREPIPVTTGTGEALWGSTMGQLVPHRDVATIFRGLNMNTVAHLTGRAYVQTCRRPAGSVPRGSSLGTVWAAEGAAGPDAAILPNVAIGVESYNAEHGTEASAVGLARAEEIEVLLGAPTRELPGALGRLLAEAKERSESCVGHTYREPSPRAQFALSRERLARLRADDVAARFAFDRVGDPEIDRVRAIYGISSGDTNTPAIRAAVAGKLLSTGLSRAVSVGMSESLDTHFDWAGLQPPRQEAGFDAVASLLTDIRETDDPDLERTTVVVCSEFARRPIFNGRGGRDHWFVGAMMVFGRGLRPGVFGATGADDLGLLELDFGTGRPHPGGEVLRPEHIAATLTASVGLDHSVYRVDPLDAWLA